MSFDFKSDLFKANLKEKWLNYYESNHHWISEVTCWNNNPDCSRPTSTFILGVISVIEPKLPELILFLCGLSTEPEEITKALGLNFDPDEELEKRSQEKAKAIKTIPPQTESDAEYLDKLRQENIT